MAQQISESELVLMRIIWKNGGAALYSLIMQDKRMNIYSLYYTSLSSSTDLISVPNTFWHSY